tara:strand:+ start:2628 stop:4118 length:1491 start_codon:yes stop_codon:yes gene_type:complete
MNDYTYDFFEKIYKSKKSQIISKDFITDLETPISALLKLSPNEKYSFLLESVEGGKQRGRYSLLGIKPDIIWECKKNQINLIDLTNGEKKVKILNTSPFISLRNLLNDSLIERDSSLPPYPILVGYFGYPMIRYMEKIKLSNIDTIKIPDSIFIRPKIVAVFDNLTDKISLMTPVYYSKKINPKKAYKNAQNIIQLAINKLNSNLKKNISFKKKSQSLNPKSNFTKKQYSEIIKKAKNYIKKGDIFQVVTSQRFVMDYKLSAITLYRSLRRLNPSPFLVNLNFKDIGLVASSPEILVRLRNNKVTIRPIAGTRPRGSNAKEDQELSKDLLSDEKELAEHLMLLDLGRNDAGRISKIGSVKVTEKMIIEYYSHVMHIVSNVEGTIDKKYDAIDALIAGFPAGTVSGAPKIRAMEIIEELENHNRSFYGGAMGYFDSNGQMDTCISLRTGLVKNNKLYVQAGGGIVCDSNQIKEYDETINKAKALIKAAEESYNLLNK